VTTTSAVFTRFDLDRHLELSMEVTVGSLIVQKETSGSLTSKISFNNLRLSTEDLELKSFTMMYSRTGTKLIQHLLDSSNRFDLKADSFTLDNNGDGVNDASSESLSVVLSTNTQKLYTMAAECTSFSGSVPLAGHNATIALGRTGLYIESSGSMSQCIDFLITGSDFTSDAHAEIRVNYSGFSLSYPINDGTVSFTDKQASATTPPDSTMMVSLDHSEIRKSTTLSGRLNYIGHSFTAELHKTYAEPSGALDLLLNGGKQRAELCAVGSLDHLGDGVGLNQNYFLGLGLFGLSRSCGLVLTSGECHGNCGHCKQKEFFHFSNWFTKTYVN
jgi:hypothetical protein